MFICIGYVITLRLAIFTTTSNQHIFDLLQSLSCILVAEPIEKKEKRNWELFGSPKSGTDSASGVSEPDIDRLLKDIRYGRDPVTGMFPADTFTSPASVHRGNDHEHDHPVSERSLSKSPKKGRTDEFRPVSERSSSKSPNKGKSDDEFDPASQRSVSKSPKKQESDVFESSSPLSKNSEKISSSQSSSSPMLHVSVEEGSRQSNGVAARRRSARLLMQHSPAAKIDSCW